MPTMIEPAAEQGCCCCAPEHKTGPQLLSR
jgi:hypothetical protein